MLMSVLDNHGIDVITSQISSDRARDMFMIYGHVSSVAAPFHPVSSWFHSIASDFYWPDVCRGQGRCSSLYALRT
jgi:hypothetical protein